MIFVDRPETLRINFSIFASRHKHAKLRALFMSADTRLLFYLALPVCLSWSFAWLSWSLLFVLIERYRRVWSVFVLTGPACLTLFLLVYSVLALTCLDWPCLVLNWSLWYLS